MAEQPQVPESVTPEQFFEQLLPMGFAAQVADGGPLPHDFTLQYRVTGAGGGDWALAIRDGKMTARKGSGDADLAVTVSIDDWRDSVLGHDGAGLVLILPQRRPDRPDNSARAKQIRGTLGLELARDGKDPLRVSLTFNNATAPKVAIKMKLAEYMDMQTGKLNGQEAFMTGKLKFEGDLAFLMQIAALNA